MTDKQYYLLGGSDHPLRKWRQKNNVSQEELGKLIETDRGTIAKWEAGHQYPSTRVLVRLMVVTGFWIMPNDFFDFKAIRQKAFGHSSRSD